MDNKFNLEYCREKALGKIKEQFPDATFACFSGEYETGYWNDEKAYINKKASYEYPGCWYPGPAAFTDEDMINVLIEEGLKNVSEYKCDYFGFDLTHGDRLECYKIKRLPIGDYEIFVQAGSRVTGYSNTWTLEKEEIEGKSFEEIIAQFPLSGILWDLLSNDMSLKSFLGFNGEKF